MPDPTPPTTPRHQLTREEVVVYLEEKVVGSTCPACGQTNWQLFHEFEGDDKRMATDAALVGVGREGQFFISPPSLPVIAVVCNNCAYIRLHAKKLIEHWAIQRIEALRPAPSE